MERKLPQPGFGFAVVMALIFLALQMGLSMPLGVLDAVWEDAFHQPSPGLGRNLIIIGVVNILAASGAIAFGLFLNRMPLRRALPSPRITAGQVAAVVLVSVGGAVLLSELDNLTRWVLPPPRVFREVFTELLSRGGGIASQIFLLVIVAPLTEETMFRGIVLRGLLGRHRPWTAIVLSAVLFGAVHMNPWQFLPATFLGIAFGWFFLRTGSVPLTMIGHACFNGLALLAARQIIDLPGFSGEPVDDGLQLQPWWADLSAAVLLVAGVLLFLKSTRPYRDEVMPAPPVIPFTSDAGCSAPPEAPPRIHEGAQ